MAEETLAQAPPAESLARLTSDMDVQAKKAEDQRRQLAFRRIAHVLEAKITCRTCSKVINRHVAGVCEDCFVARLDQTPGAIRVEAAQVQEAPSQPFCSFCGRRALQEGESPVQGQTLNAGEVLLRSQANAAAICIACASAVVGRAELAGRFAAQLAIQGEAVTQCKLMMERAAQEAGQLDSKDRIDHMQNAYTLTQAAEILARIAFGGKQ